MNANYWIEHLCMTRHPEGGYYKESYRAADQITDAELPVKLDGTRNLWTSIYFLLEEGDASHFHRLKSDEMWYFHSGSPLTIYMITPSGELRREQLGLDIKAGQKPQVLVPKDTIFGSLMDEACHSLVGCMVSPGFDFKDFELFERQALLNQFPSYEKIITRLTKP